MVTERPASGTTTLWRPTGQKELDLVAQSGWKKWPPRLPEQPIFYPVTNRSYATRITREWNVPGGGVGYVTRFDVASSFLEKYPVQKVGGKDILEYWIPAEELEAMNARIVGAIMEVAEYRGPVQADEFAQTEKTLHQTLPAAWRKYLGQSSWLRRGWLSDNCYLRLVAPSESLRMMEAWQPARALHPGILVLGNDGSSEMLAVDLRKENPPVVALTTSSSGWKDATLQAESLTRFLAKVEDGSFEFRF